VIAVIHLVWGPLGPVPLRTFLESYIRHPSGAEHELVVVLNGVLVERLPELAYELERVEHRTVLLERPVQDLTAYAQAMERIGNERVCVLNSHSTILAPGWLDKLANALNGSEVGLVGATGSWASMRSYAFNYLGLPNPYRQVWTDRASMIKQFRELELERTQALPASGLVDRIYTGRALAGMAVGFPSFPAPHIRTNAFMADRLLLRRLLSVGVRRKVHAHRLESGHRSMTQQIRRAGLRVLVVDRSGQAFEPSEWPDSETFWQGEQAGLLIGDNQTNTYRDGDTARRRLLSAYAWGERATPSPATA
jgi:hypothetical protein